MYRPNLLLLALLLFVLPAGIALFLKPSTSKNPLESKEMASVEPTYAPTFVAPSGGSGSAADEPAESTPSAEAEIPKMAAAVPAAPRAGRVPTKAEEPLPGGPAPLLLGPDFLRTILDESNERTTFALPGGETATGTVELLERDEKGVFLVQGRLDSPAPGFYFFQRQTEPGVLGSLFGQVRFDDRKIAYRVEPIGPDGAPMLVARRLDQVICVELPVPPSEPTTGAAPAPAPEDGKEGPVAAPQTHPIDIPIPTYQSVLPLQSLPGASAVVFLDFEGGEGPWVGWGTFPVAPAGSTNSQIRELWQRVFEDFQPFNVNITTDRKVFESAPKNSRQRVMVTKTDTASPGNGGVANYWSFNSTSDIVCWAFYTTGKSAAEVITHEIGHTMGLSHDGRDRPDEPREEYYSGHSAGEGWAPIMGAGYYRNLTQWSKGEYPDPTNTEDDLAILTGNNNTVDYRGDDHGNDYGSASYLELFADGTVSSEGIIEERGGMDAFRFETLGGAISLRARPVAAGPNLDIVAELLTAGGSLIMANNPKEGIEATIERVLDPGEYILRIRATGYPDRAGYGYSEYATLGAYLISGTVDSGVVPDRFDVAENSAAGSVVGLVTRRNAHGRRSLIYAIESGNEEGAFAIDPGRGEITVADESLLDYELLSSQWDDPAAIELFVSITNPEEPALNELNRIVITVTDINEPPVIEATPLTVFSGTPTGTTLRKMEATDPDRFDFPLFSIAGGDPDGIFAIDADSGRLSLAAPVHAETETTYPLVVRATDQGTPALHTDATIDVTLFPLVEPYRPGTIVRTYFEGITGTSLDSLTGHANFPDRPDSEEFLSSFDGKSHGNNYGSTMRAYLLVPETGNYRFWLASDDNGQLLFNPISTPSRAAVRATVPGRTGVYQFDKYPEQVSPWITLTAGDICYIEARQKEGFGDDHVSVAWEGPGFSREVIPGHYLAPYYQNYAPSIPEHSFAVRVGAYEGKSVGRVTVTDVNAAENHHSFEITGGTGLGVFSIDTDTGLLRVSDPGALSAGNSFTLSVRAWDTGSPPTSGSGTVTIDVRDQDAVTTGEVFQQIWYGFTGGTLAALEADPRYPHAASESRAIASLDAGGGLGENYGSRIRAYIKPPVSGNYRLYVSSDDDSELRFSAGGDPASAALVAKVTGAVSPGAWTEQRGQNSGEFWLVSGERYYIETLHRQGGGDDHLQVAWKRMDMVEPTVIPGESLEPFDINVAPVWEGAPYAFGTYAGAPPGTVVGVVKAMDPEGDLLAYAILGGNTGGVFEIDPATGEISVADGTGLAAGGSFSLEVGAQDDGIGGDYPYKSVETTVAIDIGGIEVWRAGVFGADANDPLIAGDEADPEGDGLVNLIEYALGLDPLAADGGGALVLESVTLGDETYLRLTVKRKAVVADATFVVEATSNLDAASWSAGEVVIELENPTTLTARDTVPVSAAVARFLRLKIVR